MEVISFSRARVNQADDPSINPIRETTTRIHIVNTLLRLTNRTLEGAEIEQEILKSIQSIHRELNQEKQKEPREPRVSI